MGRALYWIVLSVLGVVVLVSATLIGIGLANLDEANSWTRTNCFVVDPSNSIIVNSSCSSPAFVVLLQSSENFSIYFSDPVSSFSAAAAQLDSIGPPFNASCWTRKGETLQFPSVCGSCALSCSNFSLTPQMLNSSSVDALRPLAYLYISIGSPICAAGLVLVVLFLTLYQMRQDALRRATSLVLNDADEKHEQVEKVIEL
jgi:hypothetical protein